MPSITRTKPLVVLPHSPYGRKLNFHYASLAASIFIIGNNDGIAFVDIGWCFPASNPYHLIHGEVIERGEGYWSIGDTAVAFTSPLHPPVLDLLEDWRLWLEHCADNGWTQSQLDGLAKKALSDFTAAKLTKNGA